MSQAPTQTQTPNIPRHAAIPPALRQAITSAGVALDLDRAEDATISLTARRAGAPAPAAPDGDTTVMRLSIVLDVPQERTLAIRADDAPIARWAVMGCRALTIDLPPGADSGIAIGIALEGGELAQIISIHVALMVPLHREAPAPLPPCDALDDRALMRAFESLGDNCELGIAQRRFGAEPLDLYRFSAVPIGWILHGIDCGFARIDSVADNQITLEHRPDGQHYYYVWQSRYRIQYETGIRHDLKTLETMTRESVRRMHYLAWRLMQSLREGQRILTYRSERRLDGAEILAFSDRLARQGPAFGLIVQQAAPAHGPEHGPEDSPEDRQEDFAWVAPNVLRATIGRFADTACVVEAIDAEAWRDLCRGAYRLIAQRRAQDPAMRVQA